MNLSRDSIILDIIVRSQLGDLKDTEQAIGGIAQKIAEAEEAAKDFLKSSDFRKASQELESVEDSANKAASGLGNTANEARKINSTLQESSSFYSRFISSLGSLGQRIDSTVQSLKAKRSELGTTIRAWTSFTNITGRQSQAINTLNKRFGVSRSALIGLARGANILKVALISTGIGALVVALGALFVALTKTQSGMEKLGQARSVVESTFNVIIDRAAKAGEALLNLDFKGFFSSFTGVAQEIFIEADKAIQLTKQLQELELDSLAIRKRAAETRAEIKKLNFIAEDQSQSDQKRIKAAKEAFELEKTLLDQRLEIVNQRLEVQRQQTELRGDNITNADLEAEVVLIEERSKLVQESLELQTTLNNKINAISKSIEDQTDDIDDQSEAISRLRAELEKFNREATLSDFENDIVGKLFIDAQFEIEDLETRRKELIEQIGSTISDEEFQARIKILGDDITISDLERLIQEFGDPIQLEQVLQVNTDFTTLSSNIKEGYQEAIRSAVEEISDQTIPTLTADNLIDINFDNLLEDGKIDRFIEQGRRLEDIINPEQILSPDQISKLQELGFDFEEVILAIASDRQVQTIQKQIGFLNAELSKLGKIDNLSESTQANEIKSQIEELQELLKGISIEAPDILKLEKQGERKSLAELLGLSDDDVDNIVKTVDLVGNAIEDLFAKRTKSFDALIQAQQEAVRKASSTAVDGNAEQLQLEEERLSKLLEARERALERERQLAAAQVAVSSTVAIASAISTIAQGANPIEIVAQVATILASIVAITTAINSAFSSLPSFKKGVKSLDVDSQGVDGQGGKIIIAHKGERVLQSHLNDQILDVENEELPGLVKDGQRYRAIKVNKNLEKLNQRIKEIQQNFYQKHIANNSETVEHYNKLIKNFQIESYVTKELNNIGVNSFQDMNEMRLKMIPNMDSFIYQIMKPTAQDIQYRMQGESMSNNKTDQLLNQVKELQNTNTQIVNQNTALISEIKRNKHKLKIDSSGIALITNAHNGSEKLTKKQIAENRIFINE